MKPYARGRRDMSRLVKQGFSKDFLVQFTFALGYCRKDKEQSGKSTYLYCKGFNDCLDEHLKSLGYERPDRKRWWGVQKTGKGKAVKKTENKPKKKTQRDF